LKRSFSILLLFVFLFNVAGYYPVFLGLKYWARAEMDQRLDEENYTADETVTIKVPLTVPYNIFSQDYERASGAFEYRGEFFKLVKQKLVHDTLYIVCIKDHKEKQFHTAMTDFVKLSSDIPTSAHQTLKFYTGFIKDYMATPLAIFVHHFEGNPLTFDTKPDLDIHNNALPVRTPPPNPAI